MSDVVAKRTIQATVNNSASINGQTNVPVIRYVKDTDLYPVIDQYIGKFCVIDVSGASAGQIIKIAEVDEEGKPTAWEAFWLSELEATEIEALETLAEHGIITPAYQNGVVYTDSSGAIYVFKGE